MVCLMTFFLRRCARMHPSYHISCRLVRMRPFRQLFSGRYEITFGVIEGTDYRASLRRGPTQADELLLRVAPAVSIGCRIESSRLGIFQSVVNRTRGTNATRLRVGCAQRVRVGLPATTLMGSLWVVSEWLLIIDEAQCYSLSCSALMCAIQEGSVYTSPSFSACRWLRVGLCKNITVKVLDFCNVVLSSCNSARKNLVLSRLNDNARLSLRV